MRGDQAKETEKAARRSLCRVSICRTPPSRGKSQKVVPVKMRVYSNGRHAS
jgi:hypothetical protein